MRNLKKILALVLALMMVVSMMATASAAGFEDSASINEKYAEAVSVLAGVGIIDGIENKEDGTFNFNPQGNLTRAQAAKLVAFVMAGSLEAIDDEADVLDNPFVDLPNWATNYVKYLADAEIVNGRGNGIFAPNDTVTGYELGKMILLGADLTDVELTEKAYFVDGVKYANETLAMLAALQNGGTLEVKDVAVDGWKGLVRDELIFNEIWTKADFNLASKLTREQACYMIYNALVANGDIETVFGGKEVALGADAFGRPETNHWINKDKNDIYLTYETALKVVTDGVDVTKTGKDEKWAGYTFPATVIYNGKESNDLTVLKNAGVTVELFGKTDKDNKTTINTIVAYDYDLVVVGKTDEKSKDIALKVSGNNVTVAYNKDKESDTYKALKGYAEGDVLAICWKDAEILDIQAVTALTGKVTSTTTGIISIDGTKLTKAAKFYSDKAITVLTKADAGTFYLLNGLLLGWLETVEVDEVKPDTEVVYVTGKYTESTVEKTTSFGVTTEKVTNYYYAYVVTLAGEKVSIQVTLDQYGKLVEDALQLVTYATEKTEDKDNNKMKAEYATFANAETTGTATATTKATDKKLANNLYFASDVKFVYVSGDLGTLKVTNKTGVQVLTDASIEYVFTQPQGSNNKTITHVIVEAAFKEVKPEEKPVVLTDIVYSVEKDASIVEVLYTDAKGKDATGYIHTVYINGEKTDIITTTDTAIENGFVELTVVVDGVFTAKKLTGANLVENVAVVNMYNNMLTAGGLEDYDVSGVTVVNVSGNAKAPTDATKLGTTETISYVLSEDLKTVEVIYIVASTAK